MRPASRVAVRCASLKYAGTVITARSTSLSISPCSAKNASARCFRSRRMNAEISGGVNSRSPRPILTTPPASPATRNGSRLASSLTSSEPLAHEPLDRIHGPRRVGQQTTLGFAADVDRAVLGRRRDDRRHQRVVAAIADDDRRAVLHEGDEAVRRAEVDADDFRHAHSRGPSPWSRGHLPLDAGEQVVDVVALEHALAQRFEHGTSIGGGRAAIERARPIAPTAPRAAPRATPASLRSARAPARAAPSADRPAPPTRACRESRRAPR